jgi:hypothetical protein
MGGQAGTQAAGTGGGLGGAGASTGGSPNSGGTPVSDAAAAGSSDARFDALPSDGPGATQHPRGRWTDVVVEGGVLPDVTPVKLADGSVLLIGGYGASGVYRFVPDTNDVQTRAALPAQRGNLAASLLPNGQVLVAGGNAPDMRDGMTSCLLYDPATDRWTATADLPQQRSGQAAIAMPGGNVLVAGGVGPGVGGTPVPDVYQYSAANGMWQTMSPLSDPARFHRLFFVTPSTLLVASEAPLVYDLPSQTVTAHPSLSQFRRYAVNVQLASGAVLAIGGSPTSMTSDQRPFDVVDEYAAGASVWTRRARLSMVRYRAGAATLKDGTVVVAGGVSSFVVAGDDPAARSAERYVPSADAWYPEADAPAATGDSAVLLDDGSVLFINGTLARFYPEPWQ